jgi:hypothetical protein
MDKENDEFYVAILVKKHFARIPFEIFEKWINTCEQCGLPYVIASPESSDLHPDIHIIAIF